MNPKESKRSVKAETMLRCKKCGKLVSNDYESKMSHWEECSIGEDPEYVVFSAEKEEVN